MHNRPYNTGYEMWLGFVAQYGFSRAYDLCGKYIDAQDKEDLEKGMFCLELDVARIADNILFAM